MVSKFFKILIFCGILSATVSSWAQSKSSAAAASSESDKLDIKKLEEKYWSAKDDDFKVVQNRTYTKAKRFFLTAGAGVPFNDPFATGTMTSLQLGYFFNERWGVDLNITQSQFKDNDAVDQFISRYGITPDRNIYKGSKIASVTYVPLYAKMSFVDKAIIYFDMGFSLGLGTTDYTIKKQEGDETKSAASYQFGVNQQIFFSEHFALRVELLNRYTSEQKMKWSTTATDRDQGSKTVNDSSLNFGLTYWY
ncbi:MAG: outer membrane beta-barrel domain-containing protein [Pseudobdellovibrionaceae bacterium]